MRRASVPSTLPVEEKFRECGTVISWPVTVPPVDGALPLMVFTRWTNVMP